MGAIESAALARHIGAVFAHAAVPFGLSWVSVPLSGDQFGLITFRQSAEPRLSAAPKPIGKPANAIYPPLTERLLSWCLIVREKKGGKKLSILQ